MWLVGVGRIFRRFGGMVSVRSALWLCFVGFLVLFRLVCLLCCVGLVLWLFWLWSLCLCGWSVEFDFLYS